ncbi:sugar ABC transporter substrate-binding protein [Alkalihalobacillus deserti]|uniref:sugar ABC transporter substrate-binding protein n=1 Tax=Alkalihalobacillus deserti TaxID=2879466 RepID=UPI001D14C293|nr:sugar ABC transporter substrate-binding protein [Alkalihalobacillus deserti]
MILVVFVVISIGFAVTFSKRDEKPKIVVVLQELNSVHSKIVNAGLEKGFADFDLDGKVIAPDTKYSTAEQITMLKDVLKQKPDALIVTPIQSSATIPVFKEFQKKNIPVIMLNQDARWENQTTFVGTDPLRLGKMAGALLSSLTQPGDQVVFIFETKDNSVENDQIKGAKETLERVGVEVVIEQQGQDELGNERSGMSNILQNYPDIKGVFATNDSIALNALKVIEEKELKIPIIGTEGVGEMLEAIEEERLDVTLSKNPYDTGYLSVRMALKAIKGEYIEKRIDGGVDIVTKENAKMRIDFYEKEVFN